MESQSKLAKLNINELIEQIKAISSVNPKITVTHIPQKSIAISIPEQKAYFNVPLGAPEAIGELTAVHLSLLSLCPSTVALAVA